MRVAIQNLSKAYGGRDLVTDFSLDLPSGTRLCVCGPNGSGKSTILKLLAGVEGPDAGRIIIPREGRLGYVQQELDAAQLGTPLLAYVLDVLPDWNSFWEEWEQAVAAEDTVAVQALAVRQAEIEQQYGYNPEHRAKAVLSGLGFGENTWFKPLEQLSGGWRERAKLARVLTAGADILLLDEPTNHLDLEAVEWLESFLLEYAGLLVFVAHDRVFMDKIGTHLLYCSGNGKPVFRKGTFTQFIAMQEDLSEQRAREAARIQEDIERKMDFVRRFKAKSTKARQAASRQKMAKKLEKELDGLQAEPKRRELAFKWPVPPQADRTVLAVADLRFAFSDGRQMWDSLSFSVYRGQKIALVGPNGSGKSTLLKLLVHRLEKTSGSIVMGQQVRLGYFSQHQLDTLRPEGTALGEIRRLSDPRTTEEELMSVLGMFLLGKSFFERSVQGLSGGEKSRLILASLFLARCNFLVLDEPTNHLDLESREALVEALETFPGTLLMVAHDRHLLSEVAEQIWSFTPTGVEVFLDGYLGYAAYRKAEKQAEAAKNADEADTGRSSSLSREDTKRVKRERAEARNKLYREMKPLQDTYAQLEQKLEQVLSRQSQVETSLADQAIYADSTQATALLKEFHELQAEAEKVLESLALAEAQLAPYEAKKAALSDDE